MYDSPASKISKEELEKLTSGDVDFYKSVHRPIPAIIFDPTTNSTFKTLQLVDLPLEISSRMNFPTIQNIQYLKRNDIVGNINIDREQHIEQVSFYLKALVAENLMNYTMYEIFDNALSPSCYFHIIEYVDKAYAENFTINSILSEVFSYSDPLDNPAVIMDNAGQIGGDGAIRREARIDQAAKQLTSAFSTVICKALDNFINDWIVPRIIEGRAQNKLEPEYIIKNIIAEHRKLVEDSPVAHIIAIKNYARIKLDDFIMDTIHDLCSWVLKNSFCTYYYAMYDYYHTEIEDKSSEETNRRYSF